MKGLGRLLLGRGYCWQWQWGERFRPCVQVGAGVQLGNVLFLFPLAAAVATNPQSFIHRQEKQFLHAAAGPRLPPLQPEGWETETRMETRYSTCALRACVLECFNIQHSQKHHLGLGIEHMNAICKKRQVWFQGSQCFIRVRCVHAFSYRVAAGKRPLRHLHRIYIHA